MGKLIVFQWGWTCGFVYVLELHPSYQCHWASLGWQYSCKVWYTLATGVVLQEGVKVTIVMGRSNSMGTQEECFVHWALVITKVLLHVSGIWLNYMGMIR